MVLIPQVLGSLADQITYPSVISVAERTTAQTEELLEVRPRSANCPPSCSRTCSCRFGAALNPVGWFSAAAAAHHRPGGASIFSSFALIRPLEYHGSRRALAALKMWGQKCLLTRQNTPWPHARRQVLIHPAHCPPLQVLDLVGIKYLVARWGGDTASGLVRLLPPRANPTAARCRIDRGRAGRPR